MALSQDIDLGAEPGAHGWFGFDDTAIMHLCPHARCRLAAVHADQFPVDADLVGRLLRRQLPAYAQLPMRRVASGGTVNAVFRLGRDLSVRLPLTADGVGSVLLESRWLPRLAPLLPVAVPGVVFTGEPSDGFPFPWAVHRWLDGRPLVEGRAPDAVVRAVARFVDTFRSIDLPDAPPAHRSTPLAAVDAEARAAFESLRSFDEEIDVDAVVSTWARVTAVPYDEAQRRWIHSDLMPSNLLAANGRLGAVLDFGTVGIGDPAVDLIPAWNLCTPRSREIFRNHVDSDDLTWERGRGWAMSMAAVQLPYYRDTNPIISANARWVLRQVLTD
ncbi:aminoglycoside phosphotransferase family protein [uncultured Jatrophihabitans sp.]|uniref:aminoglycoside phosphotransferase family protein n=1 Tax=uncultured Jatrophihabitans sp. TaxID=1610747 RepID=UPI0035CC38B9